jgi:hypothetical protein
MRDYRRAFKMRNTSKNSIAYHEAGHVVAYWDLTGGAPMRATIEPSVGQLGRVDYKSLINKPHLDIGHSNKMRLRAEHSIMIKLAGPIAQQRYSSRSIRDYHASHDWLTAVDLARRLNDSERAAMAYIGWLEYRTADLIEHHWQTIKRVGKALLRQNTLSRAELHKILTLTGLLLLLYFISVPVRTEVPMVIAVISAGFPGGIQAVTSA